MKPAHDFSAAPLINEEWWRWHVSYSKFRRMGLDMIAASFKHEKPKANVLFVTGLTESFIKYSEVIQEIYENGFNVFTYDHQSQGFSGKMLEAEPQSLWVSSFEDYIDDFTFFATTVAKDFPSLPNYLLSHSMGGLIAAIVMSRLPTLVNRAVLCAPMFRNKCGMKAIDYKFPLPQPVAYWVTSIACFFGLGTMHTIGYFKEDPTDRMNVNVVTSCQEQLDKWQALREKYPKLVATCVTNDWLIHAVRAESKFSHRYQFVRTNTLVLSAETDYLVYNRAMAMFVKKAPAAKMFHVPGSYHEILQETPKIRGAAMKVVLAYFNQETDDVSHVQPVDPMVPFDITSPIYTLPELIIRGSGILLAAAGMIAGVSLILSGGRRK